MINKRQRIPRRQSKQTIQRHWEHRGHNTKKNKTKTHKYVLDITICKQTQIRHYPSYKQQLEVKTNCTSFLCGNRNGHHKTWRQMFWIRYDIQKFYLQYVQCYRILLDIILTSVSCKYILIQHTKSFFVYLELRFQKKYNTLQ